MSRERIAMVTGAASGIGRATAIRLALRGDAVVVTDLDRDALAATCEAVKESSGEAWPFVLDVRESAAVEQVFQNTEERWGAITTLVCAAGVARHKPFTSLSMTDWGVVLETHLTGSFHCAQSALSRLVKLHTGAIVFLSSDFAVTGMPGGANYAAAKTALYSLTKALALEFAPYGVRVNAMGPGKIDTPLLRAGRSPAEWQDAVHALTERVPAGRLGKPEEVAAAIDFISSDRATFITGQLVQPNGGQVMW